MLYEWPLRANFGYGLEQLGRGDLPQHLEALPTWFGIPASVEDYIATADRSPTVIAARGGQDVGLLTLLRHSRYAAEVYVMAVLPELHRLGIGRALLARAEGILAADAIMMIIGTHSSQPEKHRWLRLATPRSDLLMDRSSH